MTRIDNPMARAIIDPPTCRDCGVDIPPDHEPDLPYCEDCLALRDEPAAFYTVGTRVQITSDRPMRGRYGVIDRWGINRWKEGTYRVTDPHAREVLGYYNHWELTPTTEGKPPVDPQTTRLGVDLLLAPHRARLEKTNG